MKLIYRHPITGRKIVRRYDRWGELMQAAWRLYRLHRPMHVLNVAADAAWQAMEEVLP